MELNSQVQSTTSYKIKNQFKNKEKGMSKNAKDIIRKRNIESRQTNRPDSYALTYKGKIGGKDRGQL